jgi:hypothetical protein
MQSQTEELTSELKTFESERKPKNLVLYEEYSHSSIVETIRARRANYSKATRERRNEIEEEVGAEINNFRRWLEETKNLKPDIAHYHAISLKSLLLGLPIGVQIAKLFSIALDNLP